MGQRSRKRRDPAEEPSPGDAMRRGYARGRERDEQLRAELEPLAAGERPGAVTVAAIVAALIAIANVVLWAAGVEVDGRKPAAGGTFVFAGLMAAAAIGMWRARYWAVIGFQTLLALVLVIAALNVFVVKDVLAGIAYVAILVLGGLLFWKLIRAMARLQMPARG